MLDAFGQANPNDVILNDLKVDPGEALVVAGTAKSYFAVAKLAKALEASNVKVGDGAADNNIPYFKNVNITSTTLVSGGQLAPTAKQVNFTLTAVADPGVVSGN